ncbi:MAG: hypothetical protein WA191_16375 [Telluria sp.]|nr:hypothetical protein [Telluria sp.]
MALNTPTVKNVLLKAASASSISFFGLKNWFFIECGVNDSVGCKAHDELDLGRCGIQGTK